MGRGDGLVSMSKGACGMGWGVAALVRESSDATMTLQQGFQLAVQHHQAGRLAEAEALYRQILAVEPRHAEALQLLGCIAQQRGQSDVAVDLIRRAVAAFRRAIQLQPDYAEAHSNLGNVLRDQGLLDEAIAADRRAIQLNPGYAKAHNNLGIALDEQGHREEAVAAFAQPSGSMRAPRRRAATWAAASGISAASRKRSPRAARRSRSSRTTRRRAGHRGPPSAAGRFQGWLAAV